MTVAPTLQRAAGLAFDNLQVRWLAGQLPVRTSQFSQNCLLLFDEGDPNTHPVLNWMTIISAFGQRMSVPTPLTELTITAQYVYRACWMTNQLQVQGLITLVQANAVLSNYNLFLG